MNLPERDWKLLRTLHGVALQRLSERILTECLGVLSDTASDAHSRYLRLFEVLMDRNHDMAQAFNDLRRSTAFHRLMAMRSLGVVTDEDLMAFSVETRDRLKMVEESL